MMLIKLPLRLGNADGLGIGKLSHTPDVLCPSLKPLIIVSSPWRGQTPWGVKLSKSYQEL